MSISLRFWLVDCPRYVVTFFIRINKLPEIEQGVERLYFFNEVEVENETSEFVVLFD